MYVVFSFIQKILMDKKEYIKELLFAKAALFICPHSRAVSLSEMSDCS